VCDVSVVFEVSVGVVVRVCVWCVVCVVSVHDSSKVIRWLNVNTRFVKGDNVIRDSRATYRVAKTHRMPFLYMSFPAKEPYI